MHSVDFRVKSWASATRKLSRGVDKYSGYEELTDLLGLRVITYFADEVDKVAEVLTSEFNVDWENSVDKRSIIAPDRFGYMSLHYVAKLNEIRSELAEYRRFAARFFELQIRSILQHAWAEIEHDLGYKADGGLPREFRRRFSRLAGILELADDEFFRLRDGLNRHKVEVIQELRSSPEKLDLDQATLSAFLEASPLNAIDVEISAALGQRLAPKLEPRYISSRASELTALGITNIDVLGKALESRKSHIIRFAELWSVRRVNVSPSNEVPRGISLLFLGYTLVPDSTPDQRTKWLGGPNNFRGGFLPALQTIWKRVVRDLGNPSPL